MTTCAALDAKHENQLGLLLRAAPHCSVHSQHTIFGRFVLALRAHEESSRRDRGASEPAPDRSDVDVGIRVGENLTVGESAIKLLDQRVFPVCTPSIAREVVSIDDLLQLPVIRENDRLHGWQSWLAERGVVARDIPPGPVYGDASLCLDAAMMGQGVFMAWETIACDALERGQVASPFAQRSLTGVTYWFEARQASMRKSSVRTFRQWLVAELACSVKHWSGGAAN